MASDIPAVGQGRLGHFAFPSDPGTGFYRVDGEQVRGLINEVRTWQTLTLTWRVSESVLTNRLKHLQNTAEKFETVIVSDGSFSTLDRSESGGIVDLEPPGERVPPRTEREWVVGRYRQRPIDQDVADFEVEIRFVARENREPDGSTTSDTRASDEWSFAFRGGTLATKRVQAQVNEGTDTAADTVDLSLILDANQTAIVESSATYLGSVSPREVPDGVNRYDDDSPNAENTVTVRTPDGTEPIAEGDYAVLDWRTEWLGTTRGYRVGMTLSPTDLGIGGLGVGRLGNVRLGQF